MYPLAEWLVALVAIVTIAGGLLADLVVPKTSKQHMLNPKWPPHAKFHNGQTIFLGVLLGGLSLYLLFRGEGDRRLAFVLATVAASYYWISMILAGWLPQTAWADPEFEGKSRGARSVHPQQLLAYAMLLLLAVGLMLGI